MSVREGCFPFPAPLLFGVYCPSQFLKSNNQNHRYVNLTSCISPAFVLFASHLRGGQGFPIMHVGAPASSGAAISGISAGSLPAAAPRACGLGSGRRREAPHRPLSPSPRLCFPVPRPQGPPAQPPSHQPFLLYPASGVGFSMSQFGKHHPAENGPRVIPLSRGHGSVTRCLEQSKRRKQSVLQFTGEVQCPLFCGG